MEFLGVVFFGGEREPRLRVETDAESTELERGTKTEVSSHISPLLQSTPFPV
jgi:hypothetical protein